MARSQDEIADDLRTQIAAGVYQPGQKLPRAVDLAASYGVSKSVLQAVYNTLQDEGLVRVVRGRHGGTEVRGPVAHQQIPRSRQVHRDELGYSFDQTSMTWRLLTHYGISRVQAPPHVAELLELPRTALVVVMRDRLLGLPADRHAGRPKPVPMQLATSYLPAWLAERLPVVEEPWTGRGGVLDRIEEMDAHPLQWEEFVMAGVATAEEGKRLDVPKAAALLRLATVSRLSDGRPVEVTVRTMDAARFQIGPMPIGRHASARWPVSPATEPAPPPVEREQP